MGVYSSTNEERRSSNQWRAASAHGGAIAQLVLPLEGVENPLHLSITKSDIRELSSNFTCLSQ